MTTGSLRDAKSYGARYATRVRVASPQGSSYDGREGVVAEVRGGSVFVRLTTIRTALTIPFGRSELEVLS